LLKKHLFYALKVLLPAVNPRHGTDDFISPPREVVLRIFIALKNPSLNPRTLGPVASTLPIDHRGRPKSISTHIFDIAFPSLKMLFTLMPILPILLVAEKDGKTGYYHTHFLFFTSSLAHNMTNYMTTAVESLKSKHWDNKLVIFMCQNVKSNPRYINYLKKHPKHIARTQRDLLNIFLLFEKEVHLSR
jgi:hypothetical protein